MPTPPETDQVVDLVRALALAWKNLAAYPAGHPVLDGTLEEVRQRLEDLRGPAPNVLFGVSADGLIYGESKVDSAYVQKFAHALYVRGVALLRFEAATAASDIEAFLRLLRAGTAGEQTEPLWDQLQSSGVSNIELQPVDYSAVQVTDSLDSDSFEQEEAGSLWDAILKELVAGRELTPEATRLLGNGVDAADELADLILRYGEAESADDIELDSQATFGVRFPTRVPRAGGSSHAVAELVVRAVGDHFASSTGGGRQVAVQQVAQLIRSLPEPIRAAVLRQSLADLAIDEAAGSLLHELVSTLRNDEVLEALTQISGTTKLSSHAMNLLQLLRATRPETRREETEAREIPDLSSLLGDEDIDRFNPPDHMALLDQASLFAPGHNSPVRTPAYLGDRVETVAEDALRRQLFETLLALLFSPAAGSRNPESALRRIEVLFREYTDANRFEEAVECVAHLRHLRRTTASEGLKEAINRSIARLASHKSIQGLIENIATASPEQVEELKRLTKALGPLALRELLIALTEEDNRSRRRHLFDFVVGLGPIIVPEVVAFLKDERWYVVRNMIVLLRTVEDRTSLPEIRRHANNPDLRVRLEAIKTLLAFDPKVPRELLKRAINDPDPKLAEAAIALVGSYAIGEGVDSLLEIVTTRDLFGRRRRIRLSAIRALGDLGDPRALLELKTFFVDSILPWPAREERRAAYESLSGYAVEDRALWVERGSRSRDPVIRRTCRALASRGPQE